jgi:hypothetical protein
MVGRQLSVTPGVSLGYRETLAAFAAAGINDSAATTGSHAGSEANFAEAFFAVWSKSGLHLS